MSRLHVQEWGRGERVTVLVHGMTTDAGSWWRVGPELAERGYRVLAPDLPGHGDSPRGAYTLRAMGEALAASVPRGPELAIGHSLGGTVLAYAVDRLRPARAVYEDPPWGAPPGPEVAAFLDSQRGWTRERLAAFHPGWPEQAVREKHRGLSRWDPATVEVAREYPGRRTAPPPGPSLVLAGDRQPMIDEALAGQLRTEGYEVRVVAGAGHNIHNDDVDGFLAALDGWL
ncbi:alpha/beta fold hydrolase [Streptomyces sp. SCSIO ZS0520]|uniref:alpha/beta fold hydrolase n=1 Tax=Streptomyces sp. SCSIO ZS0520 TaxID=2892996 RepID=UPI0021D7FB53|nr:alpha/beta hydrolase [Streptomyces sp. SCSIO ZS0520]